MMLWAALTTGIAMGHAVEMAAGKLEFHQVFLMGGSWLIAAVRASVSNDRPTPDSRFWPTGDTARTTLTRKTKRGRIIAIVADRLIGAWSSRHKAEMGLE